MTDSPPNAPTTYATPQDELNAILTEAAALHEKGILDEASSLRFAECITRSEELQTQIKNRGAFEATRAHAAQSAGTLPLAAAGAKADNGVTTTMFNAGSTTLSTDNDGKIHLDKAYGEGIFDEKSMTATRSDEYRKAFRSWMRTPIAGQTPTDALRTLSEGADVSGGLIAA